MKSQTRITSEQIAEAMRAFGGTVQHLSPEIELRRSSVGFRPNQTAFEDIAGINSVRVEVLKNDEDEEEQNEPASTSATAAVSQ
jgi:hypothetical protein